MNVKEIVKEYLVKNGYDGLCELDMPCGCGVEDLFACDEQEGECEPAYKRKDCVDCPAIGFGCDVEDSRYSQGCYGPNRKDRGIK